MSVPGPAGPGDGWRPAVLSRVTDDSNLAESLRRLAVAGCRSLVGCSAASVTLVGARRAVTMAATDDVATVLDTAQYEADDGPCLTAAREERVVRIDSIASDERWPTFQQAAIDRGVASSLSVPLLLEDSDTVGGLNLYGTIEGAFSQRDAQAAESFAAEASIVVANVVAYWTAVALTVNLTAAMEHRGVIEQAKGILMAATGCSPDDAFGLLRQRSQDENRKVRELAIEIVAEVQQGHRP